MKFAQIIDFETERLEEGQKLIQEYEEQARAQGRTDGPKRRTLLRDRDNPTHYMAVVEFDSYEAAMANSARPETGELSQKLGALAMRPQTFVNCDVVEQKDI